jgi:hypothetical protein
MMEKERGKIMGGEDGLQRQTSFAMSAAWGPPWTK